MMVIRRFVSNENLGFVTNQLKSVKIMYHPFSVGEQRRVKRVPLKPPALSQEEHDYIIQSLGGLSSFETPPFSQCASVRH